MGDKKQEAMQCLIPFLYEPCKGIVHSAQGMCKS